AEEVEAQVRAGRAGDAVLHADADARALFGPDARFRADACAIGDREGLSVSARFQALRAYDQAELQRDVLAQPRYVVPRLQPAVVRHPISRIDDRVAFWIAAGIRPLERLEAEAHAERVTQRARREHVEK